MGLEQREAAVEDFPHFRDGGGEFPDRVGKVEEFLGEQASAQFLLDLWMLVQRAHEFFGGVGRRHGLPHW